MFLSIWMTDGIYLFVSYLAYDLKKKEGDYEFKLWY